MFHHIIVYVPSGQKKKDVVHFEHFLPVVTAHVDRSGRLSVFSSNQLIAVFNAGCWLSWLVGEPGGNGE